MSEETKQVIVVRSKYPDGKGGLKKIRKGKLASQAAHASMKVFFDRSEVRAGQMITELTPEMVEWCEGSFAKIVVGVSTEAELLSVYEEAKEKGIPCTLIEDSGRTEFDGVPTYTAVAVGPDKVSSVDLVTSELKLL